MAALHDFIHCARDEAILYLAARKRLLRQWVANAISIELLQQHLIEEFEKHLTAISQKILKLFETVTGQQKLWVAIRQIDEKDSERFYRTILRVGKVTQDRAPKSAWIPENYGLPAFLRSEYDNGRGIVILGKNRKSHQWMATANDGRGEDKNIVAGPVIVKSLSEATEKKEMLMILYVNSPVEGCFADSHRDFMRCCTDTLSMFLSLAAQLEAAARITKISPLTRGIR